MHVTVCKPARLVQAEKVRMSHVPHCSLATCTPKTSPCGVEGPGSIGWQFDTEAIGVADRPDYWSQAIAQALHVDVSVEPLVDTPFGIRMALQDWGCLRLLHVQGSAHRSRRRGPGRADELALVLQFDGVCEIGGRGRRATLGPGDVAIMAPDFECVHAPRGTTAMRSWISASSRRRNCCRSGRTRSAIPSRHSTRRLPRCAAWRAGCWTTALACPRMPAPASLPRCWR